MPRFHESGVPTLPAKPPDIYLVQADLHRLILEGMYCATLPEARQHRGISIPPQIRASLGHPDQSIELMAYYSPVATLPSHERGWFRRSCIIYGLPWFVSASTGSLAQSAP